MNNNNFKLKIGVLSLSTLNLAPLVITSAFGAMIGYFSDVPVSRIQLIATIPNFGILLFTLFVGQLASKIPVKRLAQAGLLLIAIGGLLPLVLHSSINQLLACAFILGIGLGFLTTCIPTLSSMYFSGDERMAIMGANTAFNSMGRMFLVIIGGYLGANHWYNTYWVFLFVLVIFIVFSVCVPLDTVTKKEIKKNENTDSVNAASMSKLVFAVAICAFFVSFFYTVYPTNLSIIVQNKNLGSTSVTGLINGIGTVGGLIAGFTMKHSKRALKHFILPIGFLITGLSFLLILFGNNSILLIIGSGFSNVGTAFVFATMPFMVSILSNPVKIAASMSIMNFFNSLGKTICPIILGWFNVSAGESQFLVGAVGFLTVGLVLLFLNFGKIVEKNRFKKEAVNSV